MITKFRVGDVVRLALKDHEGLPKGSIGTITRNVLLQRDGKRILRTAINIIDGKGFLEKGIEWFVDEDILEFNTPIMSIKTSKELR